MLACVCSDGRAHGLLQFYGGNRTGRWAGRLVQLQNLVRNYLKDLKIARDAVRVGDYDLMRMLYENISSTLSQLIRTALIAGEGKTFVVADFSAIEARVTAWLANEKWRLQVFDTHGKIYEASAAMMFGIPIQHIKKGSPERDKGKVAELALGFGGSLGALKQMGGEAMGLSEPEMKDIVAMWRDRSPAIVSLWKFINGFAIKAIRNKKRYVLTRFKNLIFDFDGKVLTIQLPSGRKLFYYDAKLGVNDWGQTSIEYKGMDQKTKKWWSIKTYGGKLTENIVQAIARDCLAEAMLKLDKNGFDIVMHVHDEVVIETDLVKASEGLNIVSNILSEDLSWAPGLNLTADGYITPFYKKD